MQDKKSSMYTLANKIKSGWTTSNSVEAPVQPAVPAFPAMPQAPVIPQIPDRPQGESVISAPPVITLPTSCAYNATPVMAFVNMQEWNETYEPTLGLERGTIFPELDLPFIGEGACRYE